MSVTAAAQKTHRPPANNLFASPCFLLNTIVTTNPSMKRAESAFFAFRCAFVCRARESSPV